MNVPTDRFSLSDKGFGKGDLRESLQAVRDHGFTHLHFSHAWTRPGPMTPEEIDDWREALSETGVRVLDVHGCHSKGFNLWEEDPEARARGEELFRHRLWLTRELGGDAMVYHVPCHVEPTRELIKRFVHHLERLEDTARELGVVVALENHYLAENDKRALSACFERFSSEYIGFTLDPGHGLISGNTEWLLANACERLRILHLNDNDAENDLHWNPYQPEGTADWSRIVDAIAESPYAKPLQLEVCWRSDRHEAYDDFLTDASDAVRKLAAQVNKRAGRLPGKSKA